MKISPNGFKRTLSSSSDHITEGMDNAVDGFIGMLRGENTGRSLLKIADP